MKQSQDDKFMMTAKSVCPSDDDIDLQFDMRKLDFSSNNAISNGMIIRLTMIFIYFLKVQFQHLHQMQV